MSDQRTLLRVLNHLSLSIQEERIEAQVSFDGAKRLPVEAHRHLATTDILYLFTAGGVKKVKA